MDDATLYLLLTSITMIIVFGSNNNLKMISSSFLQWALWKDI